MKRATLVVMFALMQSLAGPTIVGADVYRLGPVEYSRNSFSVTLSMLIGGNGSEYPAGGVLDSEGNIVLLATSSSIDFSTSDNVYQQNPAGGIDCLIVKLTPDGELLFATFLGGESDEGARDISLDSNDNIIVAGFTMSSDFPVSEGSIQTDWSGGTTDGDAFIAKLSSDGLSLLWGTFLGGSGEEHLTSIDVDSQDNIFVTGRTTSTDYPTTSNAIQAELGGSSDPFVAGISADGSTLSFSSYLGGTGAETGTGVRVDSTESLVVVGLTASPDFPTNQSCVQPDYGGGAYDAFVSRIDPVGGTILGSTYLGAAGDDRGVRLALDDNDDIVLVGFTDSSEFPVTTDANQTDHKGGFDAFVSRLSPDLQSLDFSSYFGGYGTDLASDVVIDSDHNVFVTGRTTSNGFPLNDPIQTQREGGEDAYLLKFDGSNNSLVFSTYLGGRGDDVGWNLLLGSLGTVFVYGWTFSSDFPTTDANQNEHGGESDIFLTRFDQRLPEEDNTLQFEGLVIVSLIAIVAVIVVIIGLRRR
ncbi:MAG: SBBP repeat-containing protein [Candidatus Thorarchaeota archaeon]